MSLKIKGYNRTNTQEEYERFYSNEDFHHFGWLDRIFIATLVHRYGLQGMKVLDLGSGTGWYTHLFNQNGVKTVGLDLSEAGNRIAQQKYKVETCLVGDGLALPFSPNIFDAIFCSGFPPFNVQDLTGLNDLGKKLFLYLKPGGLFIFHKTTDLSGRKCSRMNHTLSTFEQYFKALNVGPIVDCYAVSPVSWGIMKSWALSSITSNAMQTLTKLTGVPLRALITVRKEIHN